MAAEPSPVQAERAAQIATSLLEALLDRDDLTEFERRLDQAVAEVGGDPVSVAHLVVAQADLASCLLYLLAVELGTDQRRVLELLSSTVANLKARDADLGARVGSLRRPA